MGLNVLGGGRVRIAGQRGRFEFLLGRGET